MNSLNQSLPRILAHDEYCQLLAKIVDSVSPLARGQNQSIPQDVRLVSPPRHVPLKI